MTGTDWALIVLGSVIGGMLYRLARRAVSGALARKQGHPVKNWLEYRREPASGLTRVHVGRKRRRVLLALLSGAPELSGYSLGRLAQVGSGTVYPFLAHLECAGWVGGEWEVMPAGEDRSRRRFYTLTPDGRAGAMEALKLKEGARL